MGDIMIIIDDLHIVHYCHPKCKPFQNICRLPEEEAFAQAYKIAVEIKAFDPEANSFYRFADTPQGFRHYYPRRMITDEYLYNKFLMLGGKPKEKHPLSFVLQGCEWLHKWFSNGSVYKIKLSTIPSEYISFTLGDSMAATKKNGEMVKEIQEGKLVMYTKEMLLNDINGYNGTVDDYMDYITEKYKYIEAQLWNDDYCIV
jgi:hypothetical protein